MDVELAGVLLGFPWFFYRRMYGYGAIFILVPIVIAVLFPSANGGSMAGAGAVGKQFYVATGLKRIAKADKLGLVGPERIDYLKRAGGVSLTAGILTGCLYIAFFALAIYGTYLEKQGAR